MHYVLTKKGLASLNQEIAIIEKRAKEVTEERTAAGQTTDGWHSEGFKLSLANQAMWERQRKELVDLKNKCRVVEPVEQKASIRVGNLFKININGETKSYTMEGVWFGNDPNVISVNSPLGLALLAKKVGEKGKFKIDDIQHNFVVLEIIEPSKAKTYAQGP